MINTNYIINFERVDKFYKEKQVLNFQEMKIFNKENLIFCIK